MPKWRQEEWRQEEGAHSMSAVQAGRREGAHSFLSVHFWGGGSGAVVEADQINPIIIKHGRQTFPPDSNAFFPSPPSLPTYPLLPTHTMPYICHIQLCSDRREERQALP